MEKYPLLRPSYYILFVPVVILALPNMLFLWGEIDILHLKISIIGSTLIAGLLGYIFWKAYKKYKVISILRNKGEYIDVTIHKLDERITTGKNPRTYYVCECKDPVTKKYYDSDEIDIEDVIFSIGDTTHLFISTEFPDIYWVDLNYIESGKNKFSKEEQETGEKTLKIMKKKSREDGKVRFQIGIIAFGLMILVPLLVLIPNLFFYINGEEALGNVTRIEPRNSNCGSKGYNCTVYDTTIHLDDIKLSYLSYTDTFSIGGYDQPISFAKYQVGSKIELIINRNNLLSQNGVRSGIEIKEFLLERILIFSVLTVFFTTLIVIFIKSN